MTDHVGLSLEHDAIRAVLVRGRRVVWWNESSSRPPDLGDVIPALLAEAPVRRWPRPMVSVAVGPHAAQVKRLGGLPPIGDAAALAAIIREAPGAFFLMNGRPLLTSGVRVESGEAGFGAAFDQASVLSLRDACRCVGWRLRLVAPAAVALPYAVVEPCFQWTDGPFCLDITRSEGHLAAVRCRRLDVAEQTGVVITPTPILAVIGNDATRFAPAFGATRLEDAEPVALRSAALAPGGNRRRGGPSVLPATVLVIAVAVLGVSPHAATIRAIRAESRIALIPAAEIQRISAAMVDLRQVTTKLEAVHRFVAGAGSITHLLGTLAQALPDESVLVGFEYGDGQGQLTLLTTDPAGAVSAVEQVSAAEPPELVGGVAREGSVGGSRQRAVVRFRAAPLVPRAAPPGDSP